VVQAKLGDALDQPAGSVVKSLVTCSAVARRVSSVVNTTATFCEPCPTTALIWPAGEGVATTLSLVVAA